MSEDGTMLIKYTIAMIEMTKKITLNIRDFAMCMNNAMHAMTKNSIMSSTLGKSSIMNKNISECLVY